MHSSVLPAAEAHCRGLMKRHRHLSDGVVTCCNAVIDRHLTT